MRRWRSLAAGAWISLGAMTLAVAPIERTVYVSVTDDKGAPVTDLTAADFAVKEGGKDREIVKVERAAAKMRLALLVDERVTGDGPTRTGLFEFMKRVQPSAEIALVLVGFRNTTLVDYTSDLNPLVGALNKFSLNPGRTSNFAEGIMEASRQFSAKRPERPVLVGVALAGDSGGDEVGGGGVTETLNHLRQSGASFHVVTIGNAGGGGEQVMGDGSRHSGGQRINVQVTNGVPKALQQIADSLLAQYAITYTLPDGVKMDKRLAVTLKRKGVTMRAPDAIPDK